MADEDMFGADEDVVGAEEAQSGQKKVGFLSGAVIQILKWVGIIVGAIIFIVTVVVVTVGFLDGGNEGVTRVPVTQEYQGVPEPLEWFRQIPQLRGSTADEVNTTYLVEPALGYNGANTQLTTELISRQIELTDVFNRYFRSHTRDELVGPENEERVKAELLESVNRQLRNGAVREIVFLQYEFPQF